MSLEIISPLNSKFNITTSICFPLTYGKTRFESMEQVKKELNDNPDAKGLWGQCSIYGLGCDCLGDVAFDSIFEAANKDCSDAILCLGRLYEYGMSYLKKDLVAAKNLYSYAYEMENIDALHSLGFLLFNEGEKAIGLSMIKQSEMMGSRGAKFHLEIIKDRVKDVAEYDFYDIPNDVFKYDAAIVNLSLQQYAVNLEDKREIKDLLIDILNDLGIRTYSEVMNEFRKRYLRNRELTCFPAVDFRGIFNEMVADKEIDSNKVEAYGITEDTVYISRKSNNIKSFVIELDDDEDWN